MKNPKPIQLLFLLLIFASCKKNYTCNCITTETVVSKSNVTYVYKYNNTSSSYSKKMTESQAKAACQSEQDGIYQTYTNLITGSGSSPQNLQYDHVSVQCSLSN